MSDDVGRRDSQSKPVRDKADRIDALARWVVKHFTKSEWTHFLRRVCPDGLDELEESGAPSHYIWNSLEYLARRGQMDKEFFCQLSQERVRCVRDIENLESAWSQPVERAMVVASPGASTNLLIQHSRGPAPGVDRVEPAGAVLLDPRIQVPWPVMFRLGGLAVASPIVLGAWLWAIGHELWTPAGCVALCVAGSMDVLARRRCWGHFFLCLVVGGMLMYYAWHLTLDPGVEGVYGLAVVLGALCASFELGVGKQTWPFLCMSIVIPVIIATNIARIMDTSEMVTMLIHGSVAVVGPLRIALEISAFFLRDDPPTSSPRSCSA